MKYFLFTSMEQMLTSTVYEGINFSGPHKRDYELYYYNTGCPKIKSALGYLSILSSLVPQKHLG